MGDMLLTYNFLSYDIGKRAVSDFDISACYENLTSLRFQLRLPGKYLVMHISRGCCGVE
jgi:hypothetical protein